MQGQQESPRLITQAFTVIAIASTLLASCTSSKTTFVPSDAAALHGACDGYLACIARVAPDRLPGVLEGYGPDGTCWKSDASAALCETACSSALETTCPVAVAVDAGSDTVISPVSSTYYVSCLPNISLGDVSKTLRFRATALFTPDGGGGGTLDMTLVALLGGATDLGHVSTESAAKPIVITGARVEANGAFDLDLNNPTIPQEANPVTNRQFTLEEGRMTGVLVSQEASCAELDGRTNTGTSLDDPGDICIFRAFSGNSGPLPALTKADFHCP